MMRDLSAPTPRGSGFFTRSEPTRLAVLVACLSLVVPGAARTVRAQAQAQGLPHAQANQLHAAIANGDVEALEYWLTVRHADPNAASDQEPGVTPLARCLALAGRVLDEPPGQRPPSTGTVAAPVASGIGLRVLQDMVALLDERGARLADAERQRFSAPVLRWYDDAVSRPAVPPATSAPDQSTTARAPASASPVPPQPPASPPAVSTTASPETPATTTSAPPPVPSKPGPVTITPDPRKACNTSGHRVYLVNKTAMTITASVTTYETAPGERSPRVTTDTYSVEPGGAWELGCDATATGGPVRWVLDRWK